MNKMNRLPTRSKLPVNGVEVVHRVGKYAGLLRWLHRQCDDGVTILMYHKVMPRQLAKAYPSRNLVVDLDTFEQQMGWLSKHFEVAPVREALESLDRRQSSSRRGRKPLACVTFDDGYRDNFEYAAPTLEKHGLRGTFFVSTGFVEGTAIWFDRASHAWLCDSAGAVRRASDAVPERREAIAGINSLGTLFDVLRAMPPESRSRAVCAIDEFLLPADEIYGAMSTDQIRKLSDAGHEVASHTVTHPFLTELDDVALRYEMERSRALVLEWTGHDVKGICYPSGDHDERVIAAAKAAGYKYGCSVRRGLAMGKEDRMTLPRRAILSSARREQTVAEFESEVVGWHDMLRNRWKRSLTYLRSGR